MISHINADGERIIMDEQKVDEAIEQLKKIGKGHDQSQWLANLDHTIDVCGGVEAFVLRESLISCNTTACMAGLVTINNAPPETIFHEFEIRIPNNRTMGYFTFAFEHLNLNHEAADTFFHRAKNLEDIQCIRSCGLTVEELEYVISTEGY